MPLTPEDASVTHYLDANGQDCYLITLADRSSIVSSAHLIDERIAQLLRSHAQRMPHLA